MHPLSSTKSSSEPTMQRPPSKNFKDLWELKDFSDFTIVTGKQEFPVHKVVLAAQSPVFASMLKNDEQVKLTNKLEIKDCSEEIVRVFLQSFYTGNVSDDEKVFELFSLACVFKFEQLKAQLEQKCVNSLDDENVFNALELGNLYKSETLFEAAYKQVKAKIFSGLARDVLKVKPDQLKQIFEIIRESENAPTSEANKSQ
jgi:hypothetical protein